MSEDLKNVRLSAKASDIADEIFESGLFDDKMSVCKFALAYAVKNYSGEIDPEKLDEQYDASGSNYNIGSIDEDKYFSQIILSLYPDTTTPYRYIRALMIFGLERLGDLQKAGQLFPLNKLL